MTSHLPDENYAEVLEDFPKPPKFPGVNRLLLGAPIEPLKRIETFSDKQFEVFVWEWLDGFRAKQYKDVQRVGSAYDMGRDVIGWIDPQGAKERKWDNYQCKHYGQKLTPSIVCVELGKLCYYTYIKAYTIPENYFLITYKGIGNSLVSLLGNSTALANEMIENWDIRCKSKITETKEIPLEGDFLKYCREFPFERIKTVAPETILTEHKQTHYHAPIFGIIPSERPQLIVPEYQETEAKALYILQLFKSFAAHLDSKVETREDIAGNSYLDLIFNDSRICYFTAESLKNFSRETFPDEQYYTELLTQFLQGLLLVAHNPDTVGLGRLQRVCELAVQLQISHVLRPLIAPNDAKGICHQLVDIGKIRWI